MSDNRKQVIQALRLNSPALIETLVKATGLPRDTVQTEVMMLVMDDLVQEHGGRYVWIGRGGREAAGAAPKTTIKKTTKTAPARKKPAKKAAPKRPKPKRTGPPYAVEVCGGCSTRYKDPATGRFVKNPNRKR